MMQVASRLFKQRSANSLYRQMNLYGWRRVNPGHVREAGNEQLPTVRARPDASADVQGVKVSAKSPLRS